MHGYTGASVGHTSLMKQVKAKKLKFFEMVKLLNFERKIGLNLSSSYPLWYVFLCCTDGSLMETMARGWLRHF